MATSAPTTPTAPTKTTSSKRGGMDWDSVPPHPDLPPPEAFSGGLPGKRETCTHRRAHLIQGNKQDNWFCGPCGATAPGVSHDALARSGEWHIPVSADTRLNGDNRQDGSHPTPPSSDYYADYASAKNGDYEGIALKLEKLAVGMQSRIDQLGRADTRPVTRKRAQEAASREKEHAALLRTQAALNALAKAWRDRKCPKLLDRVRAMSAVQSLLTANAWDHTLQSAGLQTAQYPEARAALEKLMIAYGTADALPSEDEITLRGMIREVMLHKIEGFFPTPADLARDMVENLGPEDGDTVLEPGAGTGNLLDAVRTLASKWERVAGANANLTIYACEHNYQLRAILELKGYSLIGVDFLAWEPSDEGQRPTKIVMNPPFEGDQPITHVRHAFDVLRPGGTMVALMPAGLTSKTTKVCREFATWLASRDHDSERIEGAFAKAERATGVAVDLVVIRKGYMVEAA